ncbi:MAG: hypothetical protein LBD58_05020, partial [Treponema sp.]|nr:hypothetical protein [Treponema sp.]
HSKLRVTRLLARPGEAGDAAGRIGLRKPSYTAKTLGEIWKEIINMKKLLAMAFCILCAAFAAAQERKLGAA